MSPSRVVVAVIVTLCAIAISQASPVNTEQDTGSSKSSPLVGQNLVAPPQIVRYLSKVLDGLFAFVLLVLYHLYSEEKCMELTPPTKYKFFVDVPSDLSYSEEISGQLLSEVANLRIQVMTDNLKDLEAWSTPATDILEQAHLPANQKVVRIKLPADGGAVDVVGLDTMSHVVRYLLEVQMLQNGNVAHKQDVATPHEADAWISEDAYWPFKNTLDASSSSSDQVDLDHTIQGDKIIKRTLQLHDLHPKGPAFDKSFALPTFMRPKARHCSFEVRSTVMALLTFVGLFMVQLVL